MTSLSTEMTMPSNSKILLPLIETSLFKLTCKLSQVASFFPFSFALFPRFSSHIQQISEPILSLLSLVLKQPFSLKILMSRLLSKDIVIEFRFLSFSPSGLSICSLICAKTVCTSFPSPGTLL